MNQLKSDVIAWLNDEQRDYYAGVALYWRLPNRQHHLLGSVFRQKNKVNWQRLFKAFQMALVDNAFDYAAEKGISIKKEAPAIVAEPPARKNVVVIDVDEPEEQEAPPESPADGGEMVKLDDVAKLQIEKRALWNARATMANNMYALTTDEEREAMGKELDAVHDKMVWVDKSIDLHKSGKTPDPTKAPGVKTFTLKEDLVGLMSQQRSQRTLRSRVLKELSAYPATDHPNHMNNNKKLQQINKKLALIEVEINKIQGK